MNLRSHKMISMALALTVLISASFVTYVSGALATNPRGVTTRFGRVDLIRTDARIRLAKQACRAYRPGLLQIVQRGARSVAPRSPAPDPRD